MTADQTQLHSSLPEGWHYDRLKDVVSLRNEKVDCQSEAEDYLELEDIESGTGNILNRRNTLDVASAVTIFRKGDVLFGKLRPYLEKYFEATFDGKCTGEILAFKPDRIHAGFLRYCIASPWFIERCNMLAYGAKMPRVNWPTQLAQFDLPLPSLVEQKNIAGHLDAVSAAIESAVDAKRKQIELLKGVRKSLLQKIVTRGLSPKPKLTETGNLWLEQVPAGWSLVMLKRLADIQGGITLGKNYENEETLEYPYLRVANVQDGYVDLDDVTTLDVPPAQAAGVMLRAGDVLMTEGGDLDKLGRGTVWDGQIAPCLHQNHVFAVRCYKHKLLPHFLAYVTAAQYGRDYFEATGKRTTNLAATNATKVGAFYIPLPPVAEQRELVRHLDTELGRLNAIEANIRKQIDTLIAYRKSLIHECVTGQRRIASADFSESGGHA
jgi:type I restriction enzyme S subunit